MATLIPDVTVNALIVAAFVTVRSEIVPVVVLTDAEVIFPTTVSIFILAPPVTVRAFILAVLFTVRSVIAPIVVLIDPALILFVTVNASAVTVDAVTTPLNVPPATVPGTDRFPITPLTVLKVCDVILPDTVRLATLIPPVTVSALMVAPLVTARSDIVPVVELKDAELILPTTVSAFRFAPPVTVRAFTLVVLFTVRSVIMPVVVLKEPELILFVTVNTSAVTVDAVTTPLNVPPVTVPGTDKLPITPLTVLKV